MKGKLLEGEKLEEEILELQRKIEKELFRCKQREKFNDFRNRIFEKTEV